MKNFQEWWDNLSLREKQTMSLGSVVVILLLVYEIIWSPFTNKVTHLREQVRHNQELLIWMRQTDQQLQQLATTSKAKPVQLTGSLLSTVQEQMKKNPLAQHATQLRQTENDSVQLNLQKVSFDQLIVFLTTLWNQYHIIVTQLTVIPTATSGEVTADLVIKLA